MRADWLGDVLADAGLTVILHGQPQGRGRAMASVEAVVAHDTVTPPSWSDAKVCDLLRDGRSDLPGPLAQLGVDRQGRFRWIADGLCHHNGYGKYGNRTIGIEVFCHGGANPHEPWNAEQRRAVLVGSAAILAHLDLPVGRFFGHKETDPRRKIDPFGVDLHAFRRDLAAFMHPPEPPEEDEMRLIRNAKSNAVYASVGPLRWEHVVNSAVAEAYAGADWLDKVQIVAPDHPIFTDSRITVVGPDAR